MTTEHEATKAAAICLAMKDDKVRFFWMKLGESLADAHVIPRLIMEGEDIKKLREP